MKARKNPGMVLLILFVVAVWPAMAYGNGPEVRYVMITDVTTRSFSVIWAASEPSTAGLEVYQDEDGTVSAVTDEDIIPHPMRSGDDTIRTAAEDNGVMKVRVTGLAPDTTYYFKTITTSNLSTDTTYNPGAAPFTSVTTESETVRTYESGGDILPFSNDLIIEPCYLDDGTTPAEGTLLLATVAGGSYPITAFVGDGVELPYGLIDLNNVFSSDTYNNLDLSQGLNLTLLNFRGLAGNSIVTHKVPVDQSLSEVKEGDPGLKSGWNFVSFQLEPGVTDTETVLAPIMDKVFAICAYNAAEGQWIFYAKNGLPSLNTLSDLHSATGYWLIMEDDASWLINGTFSTNSIHLKAGWNLVGYRLIETVELVDAIEPILNKLNSIQRYNTHTHEWRWIFYDKNGLPFLNRGQCIEPGKAYWVCVTEDCEW